MLVLALGVGGELAWEVRRGRIGMGVGSGGLGGEVC